MMSYAMSRKTIALAAIVALFVGPTVCSAAVDVQGEEETVRHLQEAEAIASRTDIENALEALEADPDGDDAILVMMEFLNPSRGFALDARTIDQEAIVVEEEGDVLTIYNVRSTVYGADKWYKVVCEAGCSFFAAEAPEERKKAMRELCGGGPCRKPKPKPRGKRGRKRGGRRGCYPGICRDCEACPEFFDCIIDRRGRALEGFGGGGGRVRCTSEFSPPDIRCSPAPDACGCNCEIECFSGQSTVEVKNKGIVFMKDLKIGDEVLSAKGEYQAVYSFGHYHETLPASFLQIHLDVPSMSDDPLEISPDHLVFLASEKNPVPASQVKVGDMLAILGKDRNNKTAAKVSKIAMVSRDGVYAPYTADATIVVNGVISSVFVTFQNSPSVVIGGYNIISYHFLEHMFEMPHRLYCTVLAGADLCKHEQHQEDGYTQWNAVGVAIVKTWLNQGLFIKVLIFVAVMTILVPLYAAEIIFTKPGAFMAAIAAVSAWHYFKKTFVSSKPGAKKLE